MQVLFLLFFLTLLSSIDHLISYFNVFLFLVDLGHEKRKIVLLNVVQVHLEAVELRTMISKNRSSLFYFLFLIPTFCSLLF